MASTAAEEPRRGGTAMARQPSNSSCSSAGSGPYLRIMKTQLNFFMTRLLFMQEEHADSLGARQTNARRMNNSNSNSFNNSGSRLPQQQRQQDRNDDGLLGYFDVGTEPTDDICVFNDNARILPNRVAKSMPPVPFPPAAPESPRKIEGRDGIIFKTPTHQKASTRSLMSMPELGDMGLDDTTHTEMLDEEYEEDSETEEEVEVPMEVVAVKEEIPAPTPTPPSPARMSRSKSPGKRASIPSVPFIPPEQRVFPKNQRRSKRGSSSGPGDERGVGRSHSSSQVRNGGNTNSSSSSDDDDSSDNQKNGMTTSSCH